MRSRELTSIAVSVLHLEPHVEFNPSEPGLLGLGTKKGRLNEPPFAFSLRTGSQRAIRFDVGQLPSKPWLKMRKGRTEIVMTAVSLNPPASVTVTLSVRLPSTSPAEFATVIAPAALTANTV